MNKQQKLRDIIYSLEPLPETEDVFELKKWLIYNHKLLQEAKKLVEEEQSVLNGDYTWFFVKFVNIKYLMNMVV